MASRDAARDRGAMIACLSLPTTEHSAETLLPMQVALLSIVPRLRVEERKEDSEGTYANLWIDLRGMPERQTIEAVIALLERVGVTSGALSLAAVPIVAEVAARSAARRTMSCVRIVRVAIGEERAFLAPLLIGVLNPDPTLANLLDGAGIEYCRDLTRVSRESVEVRFGAAGATLWRLARADDDRHMFDVMPRAFPEASLAWSEYAIKRVERLVFVLNGLCESVCGTLRDSGEGAMAVTLRFSLANRTVFEHPVRAARPTSSRSIWMRILRLELERLTLPDAVTGIALRVDALGPLGGKQGDLFDRGFVTARAAEAGLSQVLDDQKGIVVVPHNTMHPLLDKKTSWVSRDAAHALDAPVAVTAADPVLTLQLLSRPARIAVTTVERRGALVPITYRDGPVTHAIVEVSGPDLVSGGQWDAPYAREYYRCVTAEGRLVWLYRDLPECAWYLHGWWD